MIALWIDLARSSESLGLAGGSIRETSVWTVQSSQATVLITCAWRKARYAEPQFEPLGLGSTPSASSHTVEPHFEDVRGARKLCPCE